MAINNLLNTYETNIAKKLNIIRLYNDGFNERYIVKETGIPKTTVHNTITKYRNNGTIMRIKGSGRPKLLNNEDIRYLENLIHENPRISSKKMSKLLEKDKKKLYLKEQLVLHLIKLVLTQEFHEKYLAYLKKISSTEMKLQENGQIGL